MHDGFDVCQFTPGGTAGRSALAYRAGQPIFAQGDPADSVFYLLEGRVKITVTSEQGKEAVIALLGEGDFFGEGCLLGCIQRPVTAQAMAPTSAVRVEKAEMSRLLHSDPAFAERFTRHLLARNSRFEADLVDHLFHSSEQRLARLLVLLANCRKDDKPAPVPAGITHELLAEMVGTTRPRVSYFMAKFRQLGLIEYDGQLMVQPALWTAFLLN